MPELPEVETIARRLQVLLVGQTIARVQVRWPRSVATPSVPDFERGLEGRRIAEVSRRGKFVLLRLEPPTYLLVHLRMTGQMLVYAPHEAAPVDAHTHVIFSLASGMAWHFRDARKFGRLYLVADPDTIVGKLGPEPLAEELTPADFAALLGAHRRQIKPLLLDQRVLAGVGNIYADEALWQACIHPLRSAQELSSEERAGLYTALRAVLQGAIANCGTSLDGFYRDPCGAPGRNQEFLQVHVRQGQPCLRCGSPIARTVVGQRGTYYCPMCQVRRA